MPTSQFITPNATGQPFTGQTVGPAADNSATPPFTFSGDLTTGYASSAAGTLDLMAAGVKGVEVSATLVNLFGSKFIVNSSGIVTTSNNIATAGAGAVVVRAQANISAQSSNATIVTMTSAAADSDYEVSGQVNVTVSTALATTLTVSYTDVSNTARTMILPIQALSGSFVAAGAITGVGSWESPVMHIRAKASTTISIITSVGTFTGVTYSASAAIRQLS